MRKARIKEEWGAFYHCFSRVVDRRRIFDTSEKHKFRGLMRAMEGFSGVEVVTYAILGNHWHMLLYVPERREVDDADFVTRLGFLYRTPLVAHAEKHLAALRESGKDSEAEEFKAKYTYRMYDLSEFMKTVQQRFSTGFNHRHGRTGTLWEGRFRSLLTQPDASNWSASSGGQISAIAAVAAYIDLNAVRARIVDDPKDYRFCGYGEAVGGETLARQGIGTVMRSLNVEGEWADIAKEYRRFLYLTGEERTVDEHGRPIKRGFTAEEVQAVLDAGGKLTFGQALRCRVRYFTDGVVLGSREYVEEVFKRHRDHFGAKRKCGARPMAGAEWGGLHTVRRLRRAVITAPNTT